MSKSESQDAGKSSILGCKWKKVVIISGSVSFAAFLINLALLIWSVKSPGSRHGLAPLFTGSCSTVESLNLWTHLVMNILATILLSSSTYWMQCLMAPTRQDIDAAHQSGRWLDIGVLSIRNLRMFPTSKLLTLVFVATTSIPLHWLYNSAFYASYYNNEYQYFTVTKDFVTGAAFDIAPILNSTGSDLSPDFIDITPAQQLADPWIKLSAESCVEAYARFYLKEYRNLVIVSNNATGFARQNSSINNNNTGNCNDGRCGALLEAHSAKAGGYAFDW